MRTPAGDQAEKATAGITQRYQLLHIAEEAKSTVLIPDKLLAY